MVASLQFAADEVRELQMLLQREIASCRVETRHTFSHAYRDMIRERIQRLELMLNKVDALIVEAELKVQ